MQHRVHSRLALRTLLKFRRCAEGRLAREWTCWKPRSKAHDRSASDRRPTNPETLYNTEQGWGAPPIEARTPIFKKGVTSHDDEEGK
jgi:hypothetical protein